jgi:transposase
MFVTSVIDTFTSQDWHFRFASRHLDQHVAVLIDVVGRVAGSRSVATNAAGYEELIDWARSIGHLTRAGVEGTGTYGAALARKLEASGVAVLEINRPNRSVRRLRGKSDPTDAENAARSVLNGEARAIPKSQSGMVEAMRAICMARRSAVKAKTQAINQMRALLVTAPEAIRERLWEAKPEKCAARCARLQPLGRSPLLAALTQALRLLAKRWMALAQELHELDASLADLTKSAGRRLLAQFGVGPQTAATFPNRLQRVQCCCVAYTSSTPRFFFGSRWLGPRHFWRVVARQRLPIRYVVAHVLRPPISMKLRCVRVMPGRVIDVGSIRYQQPEN